MRLIIICSGCERELEVTETYSILSTEAMNIAVKNHLCNEPEVVDCLHCEDLEILQEQVKKLKLQHKGLLLELAQHRAIP